MRDLWRRGLSYAVLIFCGAAVLLALVPLAFILFYVVTQGITALNLDFFRHMPTPSGGPVKSGTLFSQSGVFSSN